MNRLSLVTGFVIMYLICNSFAFCQTVTDIDGNVYQTVTIGNQIWMAENLKVTHYSNGDEIPNVTSDTDWGSTSFGALCNYNNLEGLKDVYGHLYNWYAVNDSRNIAPAGWHIPSDVEWQILEDYLGGSTVAASKMKKISEPEPYWNWPYEGTNESEFSALPGGYRTNAGSFTQRGESANFWSSTNNGWRRTLFGSVADMHYYIRDNRSGLSIRCISDITLPVRLTSFSACVKNHSVIINWITESEVNNLGYILERFEEAGIWVQVASYKTHDALKGQGNTSNRKEYAFTDVNVESSKEYFYRLSDVSTTGEITRHVPISVFLKVDEHPQTTGMGTAYPNPFNPQTFIGYQLSEDTQVGISVFDLLGCQVKTLFSGRQLAGIYHVYWNGLNETGIRVPSGCYIIRMETEDFNQIQKVVLMK